MGARPVVRLQRMRKITAGRKGLLVLNFWPGTFSALRKNAPTACGSSRGHLSELFVGLELIGHQSPYLHPQLYYWHREAKSSNAEIDYVISSRGGIIPIEVKAGTKGQMQSLHIFLSERDLPWGIRISGENFTAYANIKTIPIYAVSQVFAL